MFFSYLITSFLYFGLPLILTALVAYLLRRFLFARFRWGWLAAIALGVALSSIKPALDLLSLQRDAQAAAADEIRPEKLALQPGRLIRLESANVAGVSCPFDCSALNNLAFATAVDRYDLPELPEGRMTIDLAQLIEASGSHASSAYDYAFVSLPVFALPDVNQPEHVSALHALIPVPPSGILDLSQMQPLYLRYTLQKDIATFPLWGITIQTRIFPSVEDVIQDLATISDADRSD